MHRIYNGTHTTCIYTCAYVCMHAGINTYKGSQARMEMLADKGAYLLDDLFIDTGVSF